MTLDSFHTILHALALTERNQAYTFFINHSPQIAQGNISSYYEARSVIIYSTNQS